MGLLVVLAAVSWAFVASRGDSARGSAAVATRRAQVAAHPTESDFAVVAARRAWEALKACEAGSPWRNPNLGPDPGDAARQRWSVANAGFVRTFRQVTPDAFDSARDRELLSHGLWTLFCEAQSRGDGRDAVRLYDLYDATEPRFSELGRVSVLAPACVLARDVARAESIWTARIASDDVIVRFYSRQGLASIRAARGDIGGARELWNAVIDDPGLSAYLKAGPRQRLALLGHTPPDLSGLEWVGGDRISLAELRGTVLVIGFVDLSRRGGVEALETLASLSRLYHDQDVTVLGVAFLGDSVERVRSVPGTNAPDRHAEPVMPVTAATFPAHVVKVRADLGIRFPLGILAADEDSWGAFSRYPMTVLLDTDGSVAYVSGGYSDDVLLDLAVHRVTAIAHPERPERR